MADWNKSKVTILGLGRSGIAAARYLAERGAQVFVSDSASPDAERQKQAGELEAEGVKVELGQHSDEAIDFGSLVITSPGISPNTDVIRKARNLGKEVICDVELAFRETKAPIIAITGTNGKSTTCALISFILEKSGRVAPACGNIGVPILTQLERKPDYLVVEVSSYQLEYCSAFSPKVGVWLNLTPDHLDWHGGLEEYIRTKRKLFANQQPDQYAVLNMDDPIVNRTTTRSEIFPFSANSPMEHMVQGAFVNEDFLCYRILGRNRIVCGINELKILGRHNVENALAAISVAAVLRMEHNEIALYLKQFEGLEHRLEYVSTIDGIPYYNDSKATNPESAIKALESFPGKPVVLIAGGRDKGTPLGEFVHSVRNHAAAVILLGEAKQRFETALREGGFENIHSVSSLEEAVDLGGKLKLGPVLLSPACASFDMFKDFENRGRVFKDIVRARLDKVAPPVQG
ncbi:MAG TPA: UDP-N-acetylmuramoyl-L-alanine--D-glutamate ligase [Candidatus Obscuribacterales bacterium]